MEYEEASRLAYEEMIRHKEEKDESWKTIKIYILKSGLSSCYFKWRFDIDNNNPEELLDVANYALFLYARMAKKI